MNKYASKTIVVNLIGGPCSGKSTIAAELFSKLKRLGVKCELVPEYIKERIYEENKTIPTNQIAIFGMEHYGIANKLNKVDVIIHDGAFPNNILYNNEDNEEFNRLIVSEYMRFNNIDFFIDRGDVKFETYGRIHNLEQSIKLDKGIKEIYKQYGLSYIEVEAEHAIEQIVPIVMEKIDNEMHTKGKT